MQQRQAVLHACWPQVLCAVLGGDERVAGSLAQGQPAWLARTPVVPALLDRLGPGASTDAQRNATAVLVALVRSHPTSPLAAAFADPAVVDRMLDAAFGPSASGRVCCSRPLLCAPAGALPACRRALSACDAASPGGRSDPHSPWLRSWNCW